MIYKAQHKLAKCYGAKVMQYQCRVAYDKRYCCIMAMATQAESNDLMSSSLALKETGL